MRWTPIAVVPMATVLTVPAHAAVYLSTEQAQRALFPGASFTPVSSGVWRTSTGATFIVSQALGKHEMITFALGVNANGSIKGIEIMTYNESYGYEVRNANWRQQFVGKTASSPLALGGDIKNISGATLSCKHITEQVKQLLSSY
jgi:Na+-translocating ferredoxin:NAD+ oxidoreductase RnfG subunit